VGAPRAPPRSVVELIPLLVCLERGRVLRLQDPLVGEQLGVVDLLGGEES